MSQLTFDELIEKLQVDPTESTLSNIADDYNQVHMSFDGYADGKFYRGFFT